MSGFPVFIGCAGWSIPKQHAGYFPPDGSHLERYARFLPAVEINSSFYRPHKPATYARWAASVPDGFRFAVKVPKLITHESRLTGCADPLDRFLGEVRELGERLGPLLVQLPPSFPFQRQRIEAFLRLLRDRFDGDVVWEPRHPSWFIDAGPDAMLAEYRVARVAADPGGEPPGGWDGLIYHRLHGSPEIYHSDYAPDRLPDIAGMVAADAAQAPVWCIFDNTALGAATHNACIVWERLYLESGKDYRLKG